MPLRKRSQKHEYRPWHRDFDAWWYTILPIRGKRDQVQRFKGPHDEEQEALVGATLTQRKPAGVDREN